MFRKAAIQCDLRLLPLAVSHLSPSHHLLANAGVPFVERLVATLALYFLPRSRHHQLHHLSQAVYLRAHKQEPFLITRL
jgi:hypothetical protein